MLRGPDGRFGARGLELKLGVAGASGVLQWLALRRKPQLERTLAGVNTAIAGCTLGAALKNY